jgi:hypothetical protein
MHGWPPEELQAFAATDDLHIAPYRENGVPGTLTWIWSVVVDDGLYVRAYYGQESSWYRSAIAFKAGVITAAGLKRDVTFEKVEGSVQDAIDAAYRVKYAGDQYLQEMVEDKARSATIRITPRGVAER